VRELDGLDEASGLIEVLSDFDQFIERGFYIRASAGVLRNGTY